MKKFLAPLLAFAVVSSVHAQQAQTRRYLIEERPVHGALRLPLDVDGNRFVEKLDRLDIIVADLTDAEAAQLRHDRSVRRIELDHEVRLLDGTGTLRPRLSARPHAISVTEASTQVTPYGVTMVRAPELWSITRGAGIKIGILDSGVDAAHPDLAGAVVGGHDFANNDDDATDDNGHGTHVAGTIAAQDNGFGVVGVAPAVQLFAIKVLNAKGSGSTSNVIRGVNWAIEHQLNIITLSLGSSDRSDIEEAAFQKAADAGLLTLAASGNSFNNDDLISFPAGYPSVISVGAIDSKGVVAEFSQRGPGLGISAPGVDVESTFIGKVAGISVTGLSSIDGGLLDGSPTTDFAGTLVLTGRGQSSDFTSAVAGKVALIERGDITFAEKSKNAKTAGAIGVIIYNNVPGVFAGTLSASETSNFLPTIGISKEDGAALKAALGLATVHFRTVETYEKLSGTSMATPHATAVAALIWSLDPGAKASAVRQALFDGAGDIGDAGFDKVFGNGLADSVGGGRKLAPQKFPALPHHRTVRH